MAMCVLQCPFRQRKERVSREEVEHRVREEREKYTEKFSEDARLFCTQVTYCMYMSVGLCVRVLWHYSRCWTRTVRLDSAVELMASQTCSLTHSSRASTGHTSWSVVSLRPSSQA